MIASNWHTKLWKICVALMLLDEGEGTQGGGMGREEGHTGRGDG